MKNMNRLAFILFFVILSCVYAGCSNRRNVLAALAVDTPTFTPVPSLAQSNPLGVCQPTPFQTGNAQIITANSSYTITRADVMLSYCDFGHPQPLTGTVRAEIQGVKAGISFDIPDGITLANGTSSNSIDVSTLTSCACSLVSFNFPGCAVVNGQRYSLVLYGDVYDPAAELRINNNCLDYGSSPKEFVFTHDNISWQKTNSIEYYIY